MPFMHTYMYVGGMVPFSNPSGILVFSEDSVQTINLTLINNGVLEVCMHVCTQFFCNLHFNFRLRMSTLSSYMLVETLH